MRVFEEHPAAKFRSLQNIVHRQRNSIILKPAMTCMSALATAVRTGEKRNLNTTSNPKNESKYMNTRSTHKKYMLMHNFSRTIK